MKLRLTEESELTFEKAIGMSGAKNWIGERLNEAVNAGRTTVEKHLKNSYFSEFEIRSDTAYILIENYEMMLVKRCVEGDYSGLRTRERELVWRPGITI